MAQAGRPIPWDKNHGGHDVIVMADKLASSSIDAKVEIVELKTGFIVYINEFRADIDRIQSLFETWVLGYNK